MKKQIVYYGGGPMRRGPVYDMEPVCGRDFCDTCGLCLACYYEEPCCNGEPGDHYWVEYVYNPPSLKGAAKR